MCVPGGWAFAPPVFIHGRTPCSGRYICDIYSQTFTYLFSRMWAFQHVNIEILEYAQEQFLHVKQNRYCEKAEVQNI